MNDQSGALQRLRSCRWKGYPRKNGRIGIRNKVLIIYTVECASFVAKKIAGMIDSDDVDVVGFYGCCDNEYAVRLLIALIRHPNIGAVLAIGLGCEYVQPHKLSEIARSEGKLADSFYIQENGGTRSSVEKGIGIVTDMLKRLAASPEADMGVCDIVVGAECGGSDFTSGLAGNAVAGRMFDFLVDLGGTAIFEEMMEAVGLKEYLVSRGETPEIAAAVAASYDKMEEHCRSIRQYGISPGNFAGGISTIEEKSMGAVQKSGSRPIRGVTKVSVPPSRKGLWLLDTLPDPYYMGFGKTNPNDSEGLIDLISCGCHAVLLVTGRGSVVGSAVAPTLKVTGNNTTYYSMAGDMDFNAGACLSGETTVDNMALELLEMVIAVCSGSKTKAEKLGHKEYCIPYKYQDVSALVNRE